MDPVYPSSGIGAPRARVQSDRINSAEYLQVARTLDQHVIALYRSLLGRDPAAGERQAWVSQLATQLAALTEIFAGSGEFQTRFRTVFP